MYPNINVFRQNFVLDKYYLNMIYCFIFVIQIIFGIIFKFIIFYIFAKTNFCINFYIC